MAYISPALTAITNAVKKASVPLTRDFNELERLQSSVRNDGMFAVRSYEKVERILKEELAKIRPSYPIICKKSDVVPMKGNYFAVSPIDGFPNFAHGNGNFAISVAMIENSNIVDAVIYNPIFDELFFAEKGCGAFKEGFRNHERLRVSGCKNIEKALISCNADTEVITKALTLSPNVIIKGAISLDLAYVAGGKSDVVISSNSTTCNIAAGMLLVKEAGGYILEIGNKDVRSEDLIKVLLNGEIIATNESLRQKIADVMAK